MEIPVELIAICLGFFGAVIGFGFKVIVSNTRAIEAINNTLTEIKTSNKYEIKDCEKSHELISNQFKDIKLKLSDHERRLDILEDK